MSAINSAYPLGQSTAAASIPVVIASNQASQAAPLVVKEQRAATSSVTSVANSAASFTALASNANRLGATIYNDDAAATVKVKLGATASATSFTVQMAAGGYYEVPFNYTGVIDAIASAATGSLRVTELTA